MSIKDISAFCITTEINNIQGVIDKIKSLGFGRVQKFQAIMGKEIPKIELMKHISPRAYFELNHGRYVHEALSGLGSVGCFLSHRECWKYCLELDKPIAIFEDDFTFDWDASGYFYKLYQEAVDNNYDILRLITFNDDISEYISENLYKVKNPNCSAGYLIVPKPAKLLLEYSSKIDCHVDFYTNFICEMHNLNHYGVIKRLFECETRPSTLGHNELISHKCSDPLSHTEYHTYIFLVMLLVFVFLFTLSYSAQISSNIS